MSSCANGSTLFNHSKSACTNEFVFVLHFEGASSCTPFLLSDAILRTEIGHSGLGVAFSERHMSGLVLPKSVTAFEIVYISLSFFQLVDLQTEHLLVAVRADQTSADRPTEQYPPELRLMNSPRIATSRQYGSSFGPDRRGSEFRLPRFFKRYAIGRQ